MFLDSPLEGSSYIPLPEELRNSMKGLINLTNEDQKCFLWCHVRHLNPQKNHPERIKALDREYAKRLDYKGITFPVTINQISKIERQNQININLFGYQKGFFPTRISTEKYPDHMELLYIEGDRQQHYVYFKDFNRSMFGITKNKGSNHFCMNCLKNFYSKESLVKHRKGCIVINGVQAIELPEPYIDRHGVKRIPSVYFKNHHKQLPAPFTIYADFECSITEKMSSCTPSDKKSYTEKYQKHTACGFGYKVVCHYDKNYSKDLVIYRAEDPVGEFLKSMFTEVQNCQEVIKNHFNKALKMSQRDESNFRKATRCHICQKKYRDNDGPNEEPVRDHCHVTGIYRGSAHLKCNLKSKKSAERIKIPVIFHNLKGYDSHFIIQKVGELADEDEPIPIKVIPNNKEKYMAFYLGKHLAFIDSCQFMSHSLATLADNLPENKFICTKEYFSDENKFRLMRKKGV